MELGSGNLIPGFEEGLLGAVAGETRTVALTFPADYGSQELAGRNTSFEITVKEVKLKELPEVDEDFALDAGFDDLEELREDIRKRLLEVDRAAGRRRVPQAALDAAVAAARVAVTPELVQARAREMWERMLHSLSHRGITREAYLQIVQREEADILTEMEPEAELALRREAVITAVVAAEAIDPPEERPARGARADRRARRDRAREAARAARQCRAPGGGSRGSGGACRDRSDRRRGHADPARAGAGARAAVDARQGATRRATGATSEPAARTCQVVDTRSLAF